MRYHRKQPPSPLISRNEWCFNTQKKTCKHDPSGLVVSVIIPSYNQGQFLESAIRSVLLQDYPRIECIVIDGGSKDNSREILEYYNKCITYWQSEPDDGQADAVNIGLEKSSGKIAMFLNSDDMIFPGAIGKVVNTFMKHPDIMVVYGHRILIGAEGELQGWGRTCEFNPEKSGFTLPSESSYWRTDASVDPLVFRSDLKFALDLDFFCRLYLSCNKKRFFLIDSFQGYFRVHDEAKSFTMQEVCNSETQALWLELFGTKWDPSKLKSSKNAIDHYLMALKYPRRILIPWILGKLARIGKGSKES